MDARRPESDPDGDMDPKPDIAAGPAPAGTSPPPRLTLPVGRELHLWAIARDDPPRVVAALARLLTPAERARADRFRLLPDRDRAVIGRGTLRALLGMYLGRPPEAIPLVLSYHGKPELAPGLGTDLAFNLSHAGRWILIAFARGRPVGVDVERMRDVPDMEAIARDVLTPEIADRLTACTGMERRVTFFEAWTQAEARSKALGTGLAGMHPSAEGGAGASAASDGADVSWTLLAAAPEPGYAGVVASPGPTSRVVARHWSRSAGMRFWHPPAPVFPPEPHRPDVPRSAM